MQNPISYPFVRDATFISGVGPSIGASFLNLGQDALTDLYGPLLGRSATWEHDDFEELAWPPGMLGRLSILTNTNGGGTMLSLPLAPTAAGEHGIVEVLATNAASYSFNAEGAQANLDDFDFLFSAKVQIVTLANLESVGNRGFQIGLFSDNEGAATSCRFLAGNDEANWIARVGSTDTDTGIPVVDGQWYDLQMCRLSTNVLSYIDGALVATTAHNVAMNTARRRVGSISPGAAVGDGFRLDHFKNWMQR